MGRGRVGDGEGARVGDGERVGGTPDARVGVAVGIGVAVGSFLPQAAVNKLSPTMVRNTIVDCLLIGASFGSDRIL